MSANHQDSRVSQLPSDWQVSDNKLSREVGLEHFTEIIVLVDQIAEIAEAHHHHPDLCVFRYNRLKIEITTHRQNRLTAKDYQLARAIDSVLASG